MLCYIEYYFYLILCIVDKLIAVEDEERKVAYGLLKEPGWFINPISYATYEHFLKFKGISVLPAEFYEFFIKKDKNWIIILLKLLFYCIILLYYFFIKLIVEIIQFLFGFFFKNIFFLKFLYFKKFFIFQYFLRYDYNNSINYFKQMFIFWVNLGIYLIIKHINFLLLLKGKCLVLLNVFEFIVIQIWNIINIIVWSLFHLFLFIIIKILKIIIKLKLYLIIIFIIFIIKFQFLVSLIVFLVSTFLNFYIESWNIPFEELFFDIRVSNNYFLLDPKVYNLGNYKLICESISLSYNARKSQWYLIEHLRKKLSYMLVFLRQLQKEYKYWFKAKCYDPLYFYILYRSRYFFYYWLFSYCDNVFFFPIRWYYFYLRINLPPIIYFYIIDVILKIIVWICWGIKFIFNKLFIYNYNILNVKELNILWLYDFINKKFKKLKG